MQNLIKKKMIDMGRDDFVNYLADLLDITRQTASEKLNGNGKFNEREIAILIVKFNLNGEELKKAIIE